MTMLRLSGAAGQTFREFGATQLDSLCRAIQFGETENVKRLFEVLVSSWGDRLIGDRPSWPSDVTDDHTPFEFSLAVDGQQTELRLLVEQQGSPTTLQSTWDMGLELNQRLLPFGASLDRFQQVQDLFAPQDPSARFSLWHAVCFRGGDAPDFKIYFNPNARGPQNAPALVQEALARLGFANAWNFLSRHVFLRGERDRILYFSLDLTGGPRARIKIYVGHQGATASELERVAASGPAYAFHDARTFCRDLSGGEGPFTNRAPITCCAFTSDSDSKPSAITLLMPIRSYAEDDRAALETVSRVLPPDAAATLRAGVHALARRPLDAGLGMQSWVSFRRQGGRSRYTIYLAPEAYGMLPPRHVALAG
jgi:DMATS type aromatic prenyltransferase